jgi:hypothetical protein
MRNGPIWKHGWTWTQKSCPPVAAHGSFSSMTTITSTAGPGPCPACSIGCGGYWRADRCDAGRPGHGAGVFRAAHDNAPSARQAIRCPKRARMKMGGSSGKRSKEGIWPSSGPCFCSDKMRGHRRFVVGVYPRGFATRADTFQAPKGPSG